VPAPTNIFADLAAASGQEIFTELYSAAGLKIERIVSHGQASAPGFWYDQDWTEWVLVLKGAALLQFEGEAEPVRLGVGDYVTIEPHRRHRVDWTDPEQQTVWLAVHLSPAVRE
jgi:cupin 2 domain-containing protein